MYWSAHLTQVSCQCVVFGGAGEHGTGRNVAPFVEMEWGAKAYDLMWDLKRVFDPDFVLNPGVLLNRDPDAHRKFLKPSPVASEIVNRCYFLLPPTVLRPPLTCREIRTRVAIGSRIDREHPNIQDGFLGLL